MEFVTPLNMTLVIVVLFSVVQFSVDRVRSRRIKAVKNNLIALGQRHAHVTISVVITAGSSQREVIRQLDHLRNHTYKKLEIIVIPRARTNPKRTVYLQAYARQFPDIKLRIITDRGRLTKSIVASRYATGKLIMWLRPNDRLPHKFFKAIAYEFVGNTVERLEISSVIALRSTISSALAAWASIRRLTFQRRPEPRTAGGYTVYRRTSVIAGKEPTARMPSLPILTQREHHLLRGRDIILIVTNLALMLLVAYLAMQNISSPWLIAIGAGIIVYILSNILWMLSVPTYTPFQKLLLILCLPFAITTNSSDKP